MHHRGHGEAEAVLLEKFPPPPTFRAHRTVVIAYLSVSHSSTDSSRSGNRLLFPRLQEILSSFHQKLRKDTRETNNVSNFYGLEFTIQESLEQRLFS